MNIIKNNLFLDFDGTLVDSVKSFTQVYSDRYKNHSQYIKPNLSLIKKWNFSDQCPLLQNDEVEDIFASSNFFDCLEPFSNTIKILEKLKDEYNITIISIGTYNNISLKSLYIAKTFPFIDNFIGIVNKGVIMNKSIIKGLINPNILNVFLDDNANNLFSIQDSSLVRFCYGALKTEWNEKWINNNGKWLKNWKEVEHELLY